MTSQEKTALEHFESTQNVFPNETDKGYILKLKVLSIPVNNRGD